MIGQTYDLLGILGPFWPSAGQLLQQACAIKMGWDEILMDLPGLEFRWDEWFNWLMKLQRIHLPWCILLEDKEVARIKLHTFSDVSSSGYGACVFIYCVYSDANVDCCFIMGKSPVAPLKS